MRYALVPVLAVLALSCAQEEQDRGIAGEPSSSLSAEAMPAGGPERGEFTPDQVPWKDGPPSLPSGSRFAVLEGNPSRQGYFAMRLELPDGYRIPPHWHPNFERLTIISGTFHLGMGEQFEQGGGMSLPAGSYAFMRPGMRHFAWAEGDTVIQVATLGPWAINYVDPATDPRRKD